MTSFPRSFAFALALLLGCGDPGGVGGLGTIPGEAECGNGIVEDGEACDGSDLGGLTCLDWYEGNWWAGGKLGCLSDCSDFDFSLCCTEGSMLVGDECVISYDCGDGILDPDESCDGGQFVASEDDCTDFGFSGGTVECLHDCRVGTSNCS
jgi:hypothetical protein